MSRHKKPKFSALLTGGILSCLFVILALAVGFSTDTIFISLGESHSALSTSYSVAGSATAKQLALDTREVRALNRAAQDHGSDFKKIGIVVANPPAGKAYRANETMHWTMVIDTYSDCQIKSWPRKTTRKSLVPSMTRYMKTAAEEFERLRKFPDVKKNFSCIYI